LAVGKRKDGESLVEIETAAGAWHSHLLESRRDRDSRPKSPSALHRQRTARNGTYKHSFTFHLNHSAHGTQANGLGNQQ
jgi:hypothetical protein